MAVPTAYLVSTKNIDGILEGMRRAAVPPRLTTDFLKQLGYASSSDRALIPVLKALGVLDGSGAPTERYRRLRDESQSGRVLAEAMRDAYEDVFAIDQEAHLLANPELRGIFARLSGKHEDVVEKMTATFRAFASRADFGGSKEVASTRREAPPPLHDGDLPEVHPLILGLIRELPPPGEVFPDAMQKNWLDIAQGAFKLIYPASTASSQAAQKASARSSATELSASE
jgi:Family of unknown function (DUF5343)